MRLVIAGGIATSAGRMTPSIEAAASAGRERRRRLIDRKPLCEAAAPHWADRVAVAQSATAVRGFVQPRVPKVLLLFFRGASAMQKTWMAFAGMLWWWLARTLRIFVAVGCSQIPCAFRFHCAARSVKSIRSTFFGEKLASPWMTNQTLWTFDTSMHPLARKLHRMSYWTPGVLSNLGSTTS